MRTTHVRPTLVVRPFPTDRLRDVPRHWLRGSALATHLANGVSLLFPSGETFFVRSVKRFAAEYEKDPVLAAEVKAFAGQEGWHSSAHERHIQMLEEQGFEVRSFLKAYEFLAYGLLERLFPDHVALAVTAACEHFTAIMAENFLLEGAKMEGFDPAMQDLLAWHSAEEIEHRAVAFDVLQRVDPRYSTRLLGLAIATSTLAGFWLLGSMHLFAQEPDRLKRIVKEGREFMRRQPFGERVFGRGIRRYLRRDFHPLDHAELDELKDAYLKDWTRSRPGSAPVVLQ